MTHYYDLAILNSDNLSKSQWEIGFCLKMAIDEEDRSIREFCEDVYGNHDKEDTLGRYVQANRFKDSIEGLPAVDFMNDFEITWWAEAQKGLEAGWDIEEMLDTLAFAHSPDGGRRKSIAWFRAKRAEATGNDPLFWRKLLTVRNSAEDLIKRFNGIKPDLEFRSTSMDTDILKHSEAVYVHLAGAKQYLEDTLYALDVLSSLEREKYAEEKVQTTEDQASQQTR